MEKYWYAVITDSECPDWGTGYYNLDEAKKKARSLRDIYPCAYVAVIELGPDPICVDEIYDLDD